MTITKLANSILLTLLLSFAQPASAQNATCAFLFTAPPVPFASSVSTESAPHPLLIEATRIQHVIEKQDDAEAALNQRLQTVLETNTPPKSWGSFIDDLPASMQRKFTLKILSRNGSRPHELVNIISELHPSEGTKAAVIVYLSQHLDTGAFSRDEVSRMFNSAERFNKFFGTDLPAGTTVSLNQLILAVKTHALVSPEDGLIGSEWLNPPLSDTRYRQKRDHEAEAKVHAANRAELETILGFAPIRLPSYLQDQINDGFVGPSLASDVEHQVRGVIVQGAYNREGFAITEKLGTRRGMAQVEKDVPGMVKALKQSLNDGALKNLSELDQRLFVDNWSLNSNPGLIKNIRQRALVVAELDPPFKPLRIEIHAFPSADVLYRTKQYVERYRAGHPDPKALAEYQTLIAEIEQLINPSSASGSLASLIADGLKADSETRKELLVLSQGYENFSAFDRLLVLEKMRVIWKARKLASSSGDARFFYFIGDRQLADMEIAEAAKVIGHLPPDPNQQIHEVLRVSAALLDHVGLDNMLTAKQIEVVKAEAAQVEKDPSLSTDKKLELISNLLSNTVDQVFYLLSRRYGEFDEKILRLVTHGSERPPVRFIDGTLRSNTVFMLSQLVDAIEIRTMERKNISHTVNGKVVHVTAQVFNPGRADGIVRVNANPLELTSHEIGVFIEMPTESGTVSGIITLGVGARLSHLQLLAKALQIPNIKFSPEALQFLKPLDGKRVHLIANKDGSVDIEEIGDANGSVSKIHAKIDVPVPDYRVEKPISFRNGIGFQDHVIAGPKGMILMKLFNTPSIKHAVPDGFLLPFGFYRRYLKATGVVDLVDQLANVKIKNKQLIALLTARIRQHFDAHPLPPEMLEEVMREMVALQKRTGHQAGYFFRSDTNIEDLPGFNGAGLNESYANVKMDPAQVDHVIRAVWASAFKEKSIMWRAKALNAQTVPVADPSEVVLPTVFAVSSGVILSKGGDGFKPGHGMISANWGIGSVVEAGAPTEELSLEGATPHRYSFTSSVVKPTANANGGLMMKPVLPGLPVLTPRQISDLTSKANLIETILGQEPKGWDIEWAVDEKGEVIILQARPVN